jgi:hypothetical protein
VAVKNRICEVSVDSGGEQSFFLAVASAGTSEGTIWNLMEPLGAGKNYRERKLVQPLSNLLRTAVKTNR